MTLDGGGAEEALNVLCGAISAGVQIGAVVEKEAGVGEGETRRPKVGVEFARVWRKIQKQKNIRLTFGLMHGLIFHFDSVTCLN